jgi:hypothetical protein
LLIFKAQGVGASLLGNQLSALFLELTVNFHEGIFIGIATIAKFTCARRIFLFTS